MAKKSTSQFYILVLVLIIIVLGYFLWKKNVPASTPTATVTPASPVTIVPVAITEQNIKETNFTGSRPIIKGSGPLVEAATTYINQTVASFKETADEEVPPMRAQYGSDAAPATYTIDIRATDVKNPTTESIVLDEYDYTGGANGTSLYKVFTASKETGKLLSLSDVIKADKQEEFTAFVKNKLSTWSPDGSDGPVAFQDIVKGLTFVSFTNWSLNKDNLIIYFSKYEIGPGALGAVAFPVSRVTISGDLVPGY